MTRDLPRMNNKRTIENNPSKTEMEDCITKKGFKELQSLKDNSTTDGPQRTVSIKWLKSLEILKRSRETLDANVKDLS